MKAQIERPAAVFAELCSADAIAGDRAVAAAMRLQSDDPATAQHALVVRFWRSLLGLLPNPRLAMGHAETRSPAGLSRLPPGLRALVLLRWLSGLDAIALGAILGRPPAAIRGVLERAEALTGEGWTKAQTDVLARVDGLAASRLVAIATWRSVPRDMPNWGAEAATGQAWSAISRRLAVAVVAITAAAFAATWWLPGTLWGEDGVPQVRTRVLADATPKSRFDADAAIASHPDRVLLSMSEADAAIARDAAFYAWYQAERLGTSTYEPQAPLDEAPEGGASSEETGSHAQ